MENYSTKVTWKQFLDLRKEPVLVLSIIAGFGAIYAFFQTENEFWKMFWAAVSTIGIGVGVTYYGFLISDLSKFNKLMLKVKSMEKEDAVKQKELEMLSKTSVEGLKTITNNILIYYSGKHIPLDDFGKRLISDISTIVKYYEPYYRPDFKTEWAEFIRTAGKIENERDEKKREFISYERDNFVFTFSAYGVNNIHSYTGSYDADQAMFKSPYLQSIVQPPNVFKVDDSSSEENVEYRIRSDKDDDTSES